MKNNYLIVNENIVAHSIGEYEEVVGFLQHLKVTEKSGTNILLNISCRWYEIPYDRALECKINRVDPGQRIAILRLDGKFYFRVEDDGRQNQCL